MCPTCGTAGKKLLSASSIIFKGSGFYTTDYRSSGYIEAQSRDKDSTPATPATPAPKTDGGSGGASTASSAKPADTSTGSNGSSGGTIASTGGNGGKEQACAA